MSSASPRPLARSRHGAALIKLGNLAYHLDTPARTQYLPMGVSVRTMKALAAAQMVDLVAFDDPWVGYTLTSAGLALYCTRTSAPPRAYRVHVQRYEESVVETAILDMRQAYDRVSELLADQYHNHVLNAFYQRL